MTKLTPEQVDKAERQWVKIAVANDLRYGSMPYRKAELLYFQGCMGMAAVLMEDYQPHPGWIFPVLSGRPTLEKARFEQLAKEI